MYTDKRYLPWLDRAGRLSRLKLATLMAVLAPALWMALEFLTGWLQPNPVTEAIHQSGTWAVRFVLVSLAVTPMRRIGRWGKLIAVRRMLGVAAFGYAGLHLALYIVQQHFDLVQVTEEIVSRSYLSIGFVALLGLGVLTATSTDGMIRRIGGKRWQALHRCVYALGGLALLHFMLQAKLDITQPTLMLGLFSILMGWRVLQARRLGESPSALIALAAVSSVVTALAEAAWYHVLNHLSLSDVLLANLSADDGLRPAAWVLVIGVGVTLLRIGCLLVEAKGGVVRRARSALGWRSSTV